MSSRRKAREVVLRAFYLAESREMDIEDALNEMASVDVEMLVRNEEKDDDSDNEIDEIKPFSLGLDSEEKEFALSIAKRIVKNKEKLNEQIIPVLKNWDFSRIPRIDRIILWIAVSEFMFGLDIPTQVSMDEAIELAKKYSSDKSSAFVNGVLDSIKKNLKLN
jgi:transcription antitermination protein NusB